MVEVSCSICGKKILRQPSQIKKNKTGNYFCSNECRRKSGVVCLKERLELANKRQRKKRNKWLKLLKLRVGCAVCGYSKCSKALDLHHLEYGEHRSETRGKNINVIKTVGGLIKEFKNSRLVVLCSNCHRELHAGFMELPPDIHIITGFESDPVPGAHYEIRRKSAMSNFRQLEKRSHKVPRAGDFFLRNVLRISKFGCEK